MDKGEELILFELERDCRQGLKAISKKTGLPMSTIHSKVKRLEGLGVINGYRAVLDAAKLGKPTTAFILVSIKSGLGAESKHNYRETTRRISLSPHVQELYAITGEWDLLVKVRGADMHSVGNYIFDELRAIEGVEKTMTFDAVETIKDRGTILG